MTTSPDPEPDEPGNRFYAYGESLQINAPGGSVTVNYWASGLDSPPRPWHLQPLPTDVVARPELVANIVTAVTDETPSDAEPRATFIQGTGGFGKSTLAQMACHDPAIEPAFPGGLLWLIVGQATHGADLARRINGLTERLTGSAPSLTDPIEAGHRFGEAVDAAGGAILLVIDDVWDDDQLRPLMLGGPGCRRLVTTRQRLQRATDADTVLVASMTEHQAAALLMRDLTGVKPAAVTELLAIAGGWPLLLGLSNRAISRRISVGVPAAEAVEQVAARLRAAGPAGLDVVGRAEQHRRGLVAASVAASFDLLPACTVDRYLELSAFAADADIPIDLVQQLWTVTGGLDSFEAFEVCLTLHDSSLVSMIKTNPASVRLHDVLRAHLRTITGPQRLARTNDALLTAASAQLPDPETGQWWQLQQHSRYLWDHIVEHLLAAGRATDAEALLTDLRWISARLRQSSPAALESDLNRLDTAVTTALAETVRTNGHLLRPIEPASALDDILAGLVTASPALRHIADSHAAAPTGPRLDQQWGPPAERPAGLRRSINTQHQEIRGVTIAPGGGWIATTGHSAYSSSVSVGDGWAFHPGDPDVRLWDGQTGRPLSVLHTGLRHGVGAIAVAPDGTWLATMAAFAEPGKDSPSIDIWEPATGRRLRILETGMRDSFWPQLLSSDGRRLFIAGQRTPLQVWDPVTGTRLGAWDAGHRMVFSGIAGPADGTWIATAGREDPILQLWHPDGTRLRTLDTGHVDGITDLAAALDGSWVATVGAPPGSTVHDAWSYLLNPQLSRPAPQMCVWDPSTGRLLHRLDTGLPRISTLTTDPAGRWLLIGDGPDVQLWDIPAGTRLHTIDLGTERGSHRRLLGNDRMAITADNGAIEVWDLAQGKPIHRIVADGYQSVAAEPGTGWLVTTKHRDPVLRVWTIPDRPAVLHATAPKEENTEWVQIAPGGAWLASASVNSGRRKVAVRMTDARSGATLRIIEVRHEYLNRVVIAPDASWIATCGNSLEQEERPERAVRVWDSNTGWLRREFDAGYANGVGSMLVTPQHHLATAGTTNPGLTGDPVVRIFDSSTGRCLLEYETPHPHGAGALWLSSSGKCVVTAGRVLGDRWWYVNMHRRVNGRTEPISPGLPDPHADRGVCLLDPAGQRPGLAVDTGHQGPVTKVLFGPDDRWFATVSTHDPVVRWWETATGEPLMNIDTGTDRGALLVSPDGRRMVTRTADGRLRRWDTSDGRELDCVAGDPTIGHAQLSAVSNHWFAVTGNDTVQLCTWDGRPLAAIRLDAKINSHLLTDGGRRIYLATSRGIYAYDIGLLPLE